MLYVSFLLVLRDFSGGLAVVPPAAAPAAAGRHAAGAPFRVVCRSFAPHPAAPRVRALATPLARRRTDDGSSTGYAPPFSDALWCRVSPQFQLTSQSAMQSARGSVSRPTLCSARPGAHVLVMPRRGTQPEPRQLRGRHALYQSASMHVLYQSAYLLNSQAQEAMEACTAARPSQSVRSAL